MAQRRDWTNATPAILAGHVLRPQELLARARYESAAPHPDLAPFVERYWSVDWSFAGDESLRCSTLDDPTVHLTWERGGVRRDGADGPGPWITGPSSHGRFDVELTGSGGVIGVRLAVGGIRAFLDAAGRRDRRASDLRTLRDRTASLAHWVGPNGSVGADGADRMEGGAVAAAPELDRRLLSLAPREPDGWAGFCEVRALLGDEAIASVSALEERSGMSARTLERLFARFVGIGPKRMLLRSRVMDAVAVLDAGDDRPLADIAGELGWFDQSHFVRDFRAVVGVVPSEYGNRRT
ncbi:helix-turn-helix domain-containing protein [Brachybacterium sp. DNPG3]